MLALARPVAVVEVPINQATIILAMDVSGSMCSSDIPPNRLAVAQDSAISFIEAQAKNTRIGIIAFASMAQLIMPPTNDAKALKEAVQSLVTARRTAIGTAIINSVNVILSIYTL